jgi:small subunit ribosomal protein S15
MIKKDKKSKIVKAYGTHKDDTGSSDVQVAILTERIKELTAHLKENPKDNHSRRGLLQMVAKRKKLLKDIQGRDEERYEKIAKSLKLKVNKSIKSKEDNHEENENEENK